MYEVIVIGAGPAGLSASIYLGRAKLKTLLIGKPSKSQAMLAPKIMNFFGFPEGVSGEELIKKGLKQARNYKVNVIKKEVVKLLKRGKKFKVKIDDGRVFSANAIITATGTPIMLSGIENEEKLIGNGVHYCVECDGVYYFNKKIVVIGNGNHAAEEAIDALLSSKDVTIISNDSKFIFSDYYKKEIKKKKIKLINKRIMSFIGNKKLKYIITNDNEKLMFDGVFMACGSSSALEFASDLSLKYKNNLLIVDNNNMTSEQGVFAAGNCATRCKQITKSVGDGCNAAISVVRFLKHKDYYQDYSNQNIV